MARDRVYGGAQLFDRGGHNIFCPPQHFVIKNNVVVQISWLHCQCFFLSFHKGVVVEL